MIMIFFFLKNEQGMPKCPGLTINVNVLRNFIAQPLFGVKNRAKTDQKMCPKTQNKAKCLRGDWVPIGTLRVSIGTPNLASTFHVFLMHFPYFLFFEKYFYPFSIETLSQSASNSLNLFKQC